MNRLILPAIVLAFHLVVLGTIRVPAPGARVPGTGPRPVFKLVELRELSPVSRGETDAPLDEAVPDEAAEAGETSDEARLRSGPADTAPADNAPADNAPPDTAPADNAPPDEPARDEATEAGAEEPGQAGAPSPKEQSSRDGPGAQTFYPLHLVSVPPRIPAEELRRRIRYPYDARRRGVEGVVYLELYIGESGRVVRAEVVDGPGHGLNEAAREAFRDLTVRPARRGNDAVAVRYRYPVRFELE